jgi:AcrR family transcriptional regulator
METSTKERILSAAADVFTQCGYSGASIRDIAKIARINQSQIYHHVGNKEQLWEETKTYLSDENKEIGDNLNGFIIEKKNKISGKFKKITYDDGSIEIIKA